MYGEGRKTTKVLIKGETLGKDVHMNWDRNRGREGTPIWRKRLTTRNKKGHWYGREASLEGQAPKP